MAGPSASALKILTATARAEAFLVAARSRTAASRYSEAGCDSTAETTAVQFVVDGPYIVRPRRRSGQLLHA
jgi:hypothetical protein